MGMPQKIRCKVERILNHGNHVYTLELKPERSVPFFLPGQFMHLAIDSYEPGDFWPESRVFSIASSPTKRDILSITYSVVGSFTKKMEQNLNVGSMVWVKLPYGDFVIGKNEEIVLIAGGTGITAYTAYVEGLIPEQCPNVKLFYGARSQDLLIFKSLVEKKAQELKSFSHWYFIEEGVPDETSNTLIGRLSVDSILKKVHPMKKPVFYLSGPPGMLLKMTADLQANGISSELIKTDAWE